MNFNKTLPPITHQFSFHKRANPKEKLTLEYHSYSHLDFKPPFDLLATKYKTSEWELFEHKSYNRKTQEIKVHIGSPNISKDPIYIDDRNDPQLGD